MLENAEFTVLSGLSASGTFIFSPDRDQQGSYIVAFTARDPFGNSVTETAKIHVNNINRPPVITVAEAVEVDEGGLLTIPITATDPDDELLTVTAEPLPQGAIFIPSTSTITFAPDFEQAGTYTITCTADDGSQSTAADVTIIVNDINGGGETSALLLTVDDPENPTLKTSSRITGTVNKTGSEQKLIKTSLITGLLPVSGKQGETLDVTLQGQESGDFVTHFENGISQANFGEGIIVNSITVNSETELVANITIDPDSATSTRAITVTSGNENAVSMLAFNILTGSSSLTGTLIDPDTGQPIAGAVVTLQGTSLTTLTDQNGIYIFTNIPSGDYTLIINPVDHALLSVDVSLSPDDTVDFGDQTAKGTVFDPQSPPSGGIFSVIGRGAADISFEEMTIEDVEQLIIDTIIAIGGSEAGVIDQYGNQLNPNVSGNGLVSLKLSGVQSLAMEMIAGDTHNFGQILALFLRSFDYRGNEVPILLKVIEGIQQRLDQAWFNPQDGSTEALLIVLFGQTRSISGAPPQISLNTMLNPLQTYLLISSLFTFVHNQTQPVVGAINIKPDYSADTAALLKNSFNNSLSFLFNTIFSPSSAMASPPLTGSGFSLIWEEVFTFAEPLFPEMLKNSLVVPCEALTTLPKPSTCGDGIIQSPEECDGTPGCKENCEQPLKPSPPGCKETYQLASILIANGGDAVTKASGKFADFFMSEQATRFTADRIKETYKSKSFQEAWEETKKEANALGLNTVSELLDFASGIVMDSLSSMVGELATTLFDIQVNMIIESLRPDPPLITRLEQLPDPTTGELSRVVRVTFRRSHRDPGDSTHKWFYELWRERQGTLTRVTSGRVRKPQEGPGPRVTDNEDILVFYDFAAPDGNSMYRIRAIRMIGSIVTKEPPGVLDTLFQMSAGLVPAGISTPGGNTVLTKGGITPSDVTANLKMLLDPAAKILEGIKIQKSPFSDPSPIFISLQPRPPSPPANLATDSIKGVTYMSIPIFNRIFQIKDGEMTPFADAGFIPPNQIGLAIDSTGNLYSDNAASDIRFGGRIFRFRKKDGGRSLAGTVNKYSFLLQYAHSVATQALAVATTAAGEELFIADSMGHRISKITLPDYLSYNDMSLNVLHNFMESDEFSFGPNTAMAFDHTGSLYITNGDNLLTSPWQGGYVEPVFEGSIAPTAHSRNSAVSQLTESAISTFQIHSRELSPCFPDRPICPNWV